MRSPRRFGVILALVALWTSTILAGCRHAPPGTTPQQAVAHYGADLVRGILTTQSLLITATESTPPVLSVAQAERPMDRIYQALRNAQRASASLKVYDAATTAGDKATAAAAIQTYLTAITTAIGAGFADLLPPGLAAELTKALTTIGGTIATIRAALATGSVTGNHLVEATR